MRHLFATLDMNADRLYGHVKRDKNRTTFLAFCRYPRTRYPSEVHIAIVWTIIHHTCPPKKDDRVGKRAATNNVELAYLPTNASS